MNTTVSTPTRSYIVEKFCVPIAGISLPEAEQVPEWVRDTILLTMSEASAYARPMQRRGKQVRVVDTNTGDILDIRTRQQKIRESEDARWRLAGEMTSLDLLDVPGAWSRARIDTYIELSSIDRLVSA